MSNNITLVDVSSCECIDERITLCINGVLQHKMGLTGSELSNINTLYHFNDESFVGVYGVDKLEFMFNNCLVLKKDSVREAVCGVLCLNSNQQDLLKLFDLYKICVVRDLEDSGRADLILLDAKLDQEPVTLMIRGNW